MRRRHVPRGIRGRQGLPDVARQHGGRAERDQGARRPRARGAPTPTASSVSSRTPARASRGCSSRGRDSDRVRARRRDELARSASAARGLPTEWPSAVTRDGRARDRAVTAGAAARPRGRALHRLGHEVVDARRQARLAVTGDGVGGDRNHPGTPSTASGSAATTRRATSRPSTSRHLDVEQHHVVVGARAARRGPRRPSTAVSASQPSRRSISSATFRLTALSSASRARPRDARPASAPPHRRRPRPGGGAARRGTAGIRTTNRNVEPTPSVLVTPIVPPISSTSRRLMARPEAGAAEAPGRGGVDLA